MADETNLDRMIERLEKTLQVNDATLDRWAMRNMDLLARLYIARALGEMAQAIRSLPRRISTTMKEWPM